jgi:tetratricopeptide (TPR) repeat protein
LTFFLIDIPAEVGIYISDVDELYNQINIEMRKRNYGEANDKCNDFLDLFMENEKALNVLSKLYFSSLMLDSAGSKMTPLKSYFEDLILTYGSNEKLVRKTFYLLQKCKASLGMYSDAMNGFQQIINQNPYSYLGLAAKWDYMAVHLLDSLSGIGGGLPDNTTGTEFKLFDDKPREINLKSDYDKKFDVVQREQINNNIKRSLTGSREEQVEAVKDLVKKVQQGDKRSAIELDKRNRLNEAITTRKPKDIMEHRNIIREDIEKIFTTAESLSGTENLNIIPTTFELHQNFPNPFNPATKIKFDLPQSAKVTLKIYDILGREMTKLVNNSILEAGVHTYDFSASSLSSGVYFYRIETTDPADGKMLFLMTKKMVVIK